MGPRSRVNHQSVRTRDGMPLEVAHYHARRVALALVHGNAEEAHSIIDQALTPEEPPVTKTRQEKLAMSLTEAGVSLRTANTFEVAGIRTVEQLLHTPREHLLSIPHVGESMVRKAIQVILRLDL